MKQESISNKRLPLISIIVPCYNVFPFLNQCIDSVIQQTYANWELILVDDGSKDATPQCCDMAANKDSRIHVIHKSNGGLVSSRNAGFDFVTGDWLIYLDGDDWLSLDLVENVTKAILSHKDLDLIFFCATQELKNKSVEKKWNWNQYPDGKVYNKKENRRLAAYVLNYNSGISDVWGKAFRIRWCHEFCLKHNPNLRQGEESVDLIMRSFYYAEKSLFLKKRLYHYRYNENSISKRVDEKNAFCIIDCMNAMKAFIDKIPNNDIFLHEFELRNAYVLISIAMQTYFHPKNTLNYAIRKDKFQSLINSTSLFSEAVRNVNCNQFDKFRMLAFWCIKHQYFFFLDLIGRLKYLVLKMGIFSY